MLWVTFEYAFWRQNPQSVLCDLWSFRGLLAWGLRVAENPNWIRHYLGGAFGCCSWSSKSGLGTLSTCGDAIEVGLGVPALELLLLPIISRLFTISSRVPKSNAKSAFLHLNGIDFNSFSGLKFTTTLKSVAKRSWPPEIPSKSRNLNLKVEL